MKKILIVFIFAIGVGVFATSPIRCPEFCTMEINPQCGLGYYNGRFEWFTYSNPCALEKYNCKNPNRVHHLLTGVGKCSKVLPSDASDECPTACPRDLRPVCGVGFYNSRYNWQTHNNECLLRVHNCQNPNKKQYKVKNIRDCSRIFPTSNSPGRFPFPFPLPLPIDL